MNTNRVALVAGVSQKFRMALRLSGLLICTHISNANGAYAQQDNRQQQTVIGIQTALTGNAATYGVDIKNALEFANQKLANGRYQFVVEDDKCNGKDAVSAAHKLIDVDKVKYVIGFACSGAMLSSAPIYEKFHTLAISPCASAPAISQAGDFIFRTWASDAAASKILADYIAPRHKIIGVVSEQTDYAQGFLKSFQDESEKLSSQVVNQDFLTTDTDFRSLFLKLKSSGIQAIFINSQTEQTFLALLKQLRELKLEIPIYGAHWPGSAALLDNANGMADGIIFVESESPEKAFTDEGKSLLKEFVAKYGKVNTIEMLIGTTIESFRALHMAIESGKDPQEFLYSTKFHGVFGDWYFDKNGDIQGMKFVMRRVVDGKVAELGRD